MEKATKPQVLWLGQEQLANQDKKRHKRHNHMLEMGTWALGKAGVWEPLVLVAQAQLGWSHWRQTPSEVENSSTHLHLSPPEPGEWQDTVSGLPWSVTGCHRQALAVSPNPIWSSGRSWIEDRKCTEGQEDG